jgi:Zn-dependent protease with chaperone function
LAILVIGLVAWLLSRRSRRIKKAEPLTDGEIYHRARHLAQRAGARLRTLRIVPDDTWEGANAYAIWPGRIAVSEELVQSAPADQLDATVVHELAHLRHRDTPLLALTGVALFFAIHAGLRPVLSLAIHPAWITLPQSALFFFFLSYCRRRAEYRADALASDLISPEAAVRGRLRPHRLHQAPLTRHPLLEALDTHPSTLHRVQAIGRRHGRSTEWLRAILLEECPNEDLQSLASAGLLLKTQTPSHLSAAILRGEKSP